MIKATLSLAARGEGILQRDPHGSLQGEMMRKRHAVVRSKAEKPSISNLPSPCPGKSVLFCKLYICIKFELISPCRLYGTLRANEPRMSGMRIQLTC